MAVKDKLVNLEDLKVVGDVVGDLKSAVFSENVVINVSNTASGAQAYNFIEGHIYRVVLTSTGTTQYQVGTLQSGNYVNQLTGVESGNANLNITFTASGNASQFYVYLTPSSARYTATVYELVDNFVDDAEYNDKWIVKTRGFDTVIRTGFTAESDAWGIVDGTIDNTGVTFSQGGSAFHRMPLAFDDYIFSATFKILSAGTVVGIATEGSWKSKITIDQSASKAFIYTNYNDGQTLVEAGNVALSSGLGNNKFYRIELRRNGWDYRLKVIDCTNNVALCDYKYANYSNTTSRAYGRFNGYFGVVCDAGSALCNDLSVMINHKKCKCLIIGDSLVEGDQVSNGQRWDYLLKNNYFNGDAVIAGAGGDSTTAIKTRLQQYINLGISFDVCIVLGGMNNRSEDGYTSYTTDMDAIYNMIVGADALPIIAVNPIPSSGADYIHQQRSYIVSKGWQTIRLDYAFSSSYAYNSAYFNSDGIHPNASGNAVMYQAAVTALNNLLF